jgi:ZIP family zinc transporter
MFIGVLLDGLPESFVLGITLALGGSIDAAFLAAVFVSNIPKGVAGTASLDAAGATTTRRITWGWTNLTAASAGVAALGFALADNVPHQGIWAEAFAGVAVLTMLADSSARGLPARRPLRRTRDRLGYLVAAALAVAQ